MVQRRQRPDSGVVQRREDASVELDGLLVDLAPSAVGEHARPRDRETVDFAPKRFHHRNIFLPVFETVDRRAVDVAKLVCDERVPDRRGTTPFGVASFALERRRGDAPLELVLARLVGQNAGFRRERRGEVGAVVDRFRGIGGRGRGFRGRAGRRRRRVAKLFGFRGGEEEAAGLLLLKARRDDGQRG